MGSRRQPVEDFGRNGFGKTDDLEDLPFFTTILLPNFVPHRLAPNCWFKFVISSTLLGRLQTQVGSGLLSNESTKEKEIDSGFRPFKT